MQFDAASLTAEPSLWQRVGPFCFADSRACTPDIVSAAFHCLSHWDQQPNACRDDVQSCSADNALLAIAQHILHDPTSAHSCTRHVSNYFRSANINIAFATLRQFEPCRMARYSLFVSDRLVDTATWDSPPRSPVQMSVRGIAFLQLYYLDPQFKHWPQLQQARDECILGLQTWGANNPQHQSALAVIARYLNWAI